MEKKIIEYKVITAMNADNLTKLINDKIETGWEPYGNLMIIESNRSVFFCQVIVKTEYVGSVDTEEIE